MSTLQIPLGGVPRTIEVPVDTPRGNGRSGSIHCTPGGFLYGLTEGERALVLRAYPKAKPIPDGKYVAPPPRDPKDVGEAKPEPKTPKPRRKPADT